MDVSLEFQECVQSGGDLEANPEHKDLGTPLRSSRGADGRVVWASLWKMLPSHDLDRGKKTTMKMIKIIEVKNN